MRILLVEDTEDLAEGVAACLRRMGHAVDWVPDGELADELLRDNPYEVVLLDLMLPRMSGTEVLKRLRARGSDTSVLVMTARSAIEDRVDMLDLGADDYLVKPFDFRELEARVRSLLRRRSGKRGTVLSFAALSLDRSNQEARVHGTSIRLTRRELSLLEVLLADPSRIISKASLVDQLFDHSEEPHENAIEVIVARIRPKIGSSGAAIRTHRGLGYRIEHEETEAAGTIAETV